MVHAYPTWTSELRLPLQILGLRGEQSHFCKGILGGKLAQIHRGLAVPAGEVVAVEQAGQICQWIELLACREGVCLLRNFGVISCSGVILVTGARSRAGRHEHNGPVLSVVRVGDLDEALAVGRDCPYGNGASIFTRSGWAAREFKHRFNAGMIGINVGVPAPMAWFPFTGWNQSFFGDLHIQGVEGMQFYTR